MNGLGMLDNTHRTLDDDNDDDVPTQSLGTLVKLQILRTTGGATTLSYGYE
jgi:hypothetical protein